MLQKLQMEMNRYKHIHTALSLFPATSFPSPVFLITSLPLRRTDTQVGCPLTKHKPCMYVCTIHIWLINLACLHICTSPPTILPVCVLCLGHAIHVQPHTHTHTHTFKEAMYLKQGKKTGMGGDNNGCRRKISTNLSLLLTFQEETAHLDAS